MKKFLLILAVLQIVFTSFGQFNGRDKRFVYKSIGVITQKTNTDTQDEINKLNIRLKKQNEELKKLLIDKDKVISQLAYENERQRKIIFDLKRKNDSLILIIGKKEDILAKLIMQNTELTNKYIEANDTIVKKNKKISFLQNQINNITKERDNLSIKLAQKNPDWSVATCNIEPHPKIRNAYTLTLNANTTNFSNYYYSEKTKHPNAKIFVNLERIKYDNKFIDNIYDIGDGLFKSGFVAVHEASKVKIHFKTIDKLKRNKEILPILYFYIYYDGQIQNQLGIIENLLINL